MMSNEAGSGCTVDTTTTFSLLHFGTKDLQTDIRLDRCPSQVNTMLWMIDRQAVSKGEAMGQTG